MKTNLCLSLTFTTGKRVTPFSFILAVKHRLPQQVEAGITGELDLCSGAHLHSGDMEMGHAVL